MAAIEILGLEKTYMVGFWRKRPKRALQPLHLTVEDGEIFGFLGPNGAGKTTTLKMLMGLVSPTAGTARILRTEWAGPEVKAQIGFLPEQPYFYDYLTAHELLDYYGQLSGVPAKDRKNRVEEVLQRVGLTDIKGIQLRKFSKGMLQRAGIAKAILHSPKLVFLDEPMSGLDTLRTRAVRGHLRPSPGAPASDFYHPVAHIAGILLCREIAAFSNHRGDLGMNARIAHIASNTFREAVRDRVLYNLIAFAVLISAAAIFIGQISIEIERLVVINLGLTAVSLFGMVIAIFVGIGLVSKEIEKRTLYTVLSRPVRRWEFIVGKFFGLAGTLVVNAFFMAIGVFAALLYVAHKFQKPDGWVLVALYFIILQFLIICSLALLFSSFSSPLLSAVFAFSLFVIGTFSEDLRNFAGMATGLTKWLATAVAYLIPNLSALN